MGTKERLYELLAPRTYLTSENHFLNPYLKDVQTAIDSGVGDADDLLESLNSQLEVEGEALARAFKLFDNHSTGKLSKADVKNMNRYLGFPAEDADVDKLMESIDKDKSGTLTFTEFESYVGWVGGSPKLFEERQKRLAVRGSVSGVTTLDPEQMAAGLNRAGIDQEAQAYWRMVVPATDLSEAARLKMCQAEAIAHIRRLAKKNHQEALPKLQDRLIKLGKKEDELWLTLAWIRELAPVIIHLNLDKMLQFLEKDTHYRNQFETASSGGLLKPQVREKWERDLFGGKYDKASGFERCKYGVQNVMNDYRGVVKCKQYGDSYMILKDSRLRCTFSPEDSANLKSDRLAVLDFYAHVLHEYSDQELLETLNVANSAESAILGDSDKVGSMKYKEAQIHGEVDFEKHVERLVAHTRHRDTKGMEQQLKNLCKAKGWGFSWMDQERQRMRDESMHKLGGGDWQARLEAMEQGDSGIEVPEGFCKVGCGRRCAPGVTRAGKAFKTCCRGCVMGFGHDRLCQKIDPTKVGPGLCKMGCGLPTSKGRDAKGRPLTTCCRGCALGMAHDGTCGKAPICPPAASGGSPVAAGMCKVGCGRKVAPGTTKSGRGFDTCCRDCAQGTGGHSANCIAD
eukprot:TRINITY_DN121380_c0_g1_i1.p1 TRINITY_DN121380_c0_g1~~TRINITY_DN121380_c0_g1_i1.p1  ORF type:complete len:626 (-),score=131.85 TRINITY_DN121380_c0_g1_i1:149-2026(-)